MLPNKNCMKDILLYISENIKVKVDSMHYYTIDFCSLNFSTLLAEMSTTTNYSVEEIAYNLIQCIHCNFINTRSDQNGSKIQSSTSCIFGITFQGIEFMNSQS